MSAQAQSIQRRGASQAASAELLAPAGDWDCVRAAVANGADAVYFGLPQFNARLRAQNFSEAELPEVVAFCHRHGVKAYVALNTLIFTAELPAAEAELRRCSRAGVDALIVQDVGLVRLARAIVPELPLHASTQMTVTSPEGVKFARRLGIDRVVLARELSLRELEKFAPAALPLEVFVHGALCVAYSGQCLTSEALGQRSANRGECAQACRMPYEMVVDGVERPLGDRRYLLSPQDLAAVAELPALLARGVVSFKIEGRLKSPEYVAAVCQVYRRALDAALADQPAAVTLEDRYALEMTFSRGLSTGWMHGVDHQALVPARFGKKRGPLAGAVTAVGPNYVEIAAQAPLQAGDGVVFDCGGDPDREQGGRLYEVRGTRLYFQHGLIDFSRVHEGDRVWKTDDPVLSRRLRQSFAGRLSARRPQPLEITVSGAAGGPLVLEAAGERVASEIPLQEARTAPLTTERLRAQVERLAETPYELTTLQNALEGEVILPLGELNRVRRRLLEQLGRAQPPRREDSQTWREFYESSAVLERLAPVAPSLSVLCRSEPQMAAALAAGVQMIYLDFEDLRRFRAAVAEARLLAAGAAIYLATPRIQKAGEEGFFRLLEKAAPDGVLVRNLGAIDFFHGSGLRQIGDFSLNVANPLSAQHFLEQGLERCTVSYDLNHEQILALLAVAPPSWFELTLHQHMPLFHMEHCVFAAFLSNGHSHLDCGRPCDRHRVQLRDRVGMEHPLRADVGCRNTLFQATPQTGAQFYESLHRAGVRHFRLELLEETPEQTTRLCANYQALLSGERTGDETWRKLRATSQLGVTRGTLETAAF